MIMPAIWDEPLMLELFILIALGLAFYVYVMVFVAKFGRLGRVVPPPPKPGGTTDRVLKCTTVALIVIAIVLVFFVPTTFTETRDELYTGPVERQEGMDYSRSAKVDSSVYYEYFVNLTARSQNMIRGTLKETDGEAIDLYVLDEEEFRSWLLNGTARPELSLVDVENDTVSFSLVPIANKYYVVVRDIHSLDPTEHSILRLEHFWQEWTVNSTRTVTRQVRETIFRHWTM